MLLRIRENFIHTNGILVLLDFSDEVTMQLSLTEFFSEFVCKSLLVKNGARMTKSVTQPTKLLQKNKFYSIFINCKKHPLPLIHKSSLQEKLEEEN